MNDQTHAWTDKLTERVAQSPRVLRATSTDEPDIHDLLTRLHYGEGSDLPHATLYQYETKAIPGPDFLKALKAQFPEEYPQIESLTITNRLQQIARDALAGKSSSASRHTMFLPASYWYTALEAHNQPRQWQERSDKPLWADLILPIETEGEYLRAVRNALGMTPPTVAEANGLSEVSVRKIENSNCCAASTRESLLHYYAKIEAAQREQGTLDAGLPPLVSVEAYGRMDATPRVNARAQGA